jgi:two-component system chemotaxis sensor kinase CheA
MTTTPSRDEFVDNLLGDFLDESTQLLERLNENLLQLDTWVRSLTEGQRARCEESLMNDMFRSAHSIKGLSAMLGLHEINNLTHKIENVFDAARRDELAITPDVVDLMFQATDRLSAQVNWLRSPYGASVDCSEVLSGIHNLLKATGTERKQTTQADAERALGEELAQMAQIDVAPTPKPIASATPVASAKVEVKPSRTTKTNPSAASANFHRTGTDAMSTDQDLFAGVTDDTQVPTKYLAIFIDETELALDDLTETLLAVECDNGRDPTEKLLVTAHRIKGSAACVGFHRAAKLAHFMEDLLQRLHHEGGRLTAEMTDAMLKCTDALRKYVDGLKSGSAESDSFNLFAQELLTAQSAAAPAARCEPVAIAPPMEDVAQPSAAGDDPLQQIAQRAPADQQGFVGRLTFASGLALVGLKARLAYDKLSQLGDVYYCEPSAALLDEMDEIDSLSFGLCTNDSRETLLTQLRINGIERIDVASLKELLTTTRRAAEKASVEAVEPCVSPDESPATMAPTTTTPVFTSAAVPVDDVPTEPASRNPKNAPDNAASGNRTTDHGNKPAETLRVDIERLDQLMNLAGQLVINKARFAQIGERLKQVSVGKQTHQAMNNISGVLARLADPGPTNDTRRNPQTELDNIRNHARRIQSDLEDVRRTLEQFATIRSSVNDLSEAVHQLDLVSDGIQKSVMDTRMVPIGPLFGRFRRVIRDMTRTNDKDIQLVIRGEKTELDKRMIDELGDPLIHMVRNSADHGIELPGVREAAGKPRQGTITLDAFHRGNSIVIQVTDDGKGLDQNRIREKAIEKGLITAADAEKLTPHQIYQLIWEPGFSTAEKVTEISGRGMGMDIVKSKIEEINGVVDLDSTPGEGTTLTIKLPLTLAILPSLMAEIDGDVIALPIESVVEIVNIRRCDLLAIHGMPTALVRGRVISVVHLSEVLCWHGASIHDNTRQSDDITLVILGTEGREMGLEVHRLIGEEDIVIKSMAENFRNVFGIAGASILGDGRVSLILDIAALIEKASRLTPALAAT